MTAEDIPVVVLNGRWWRQTDRKYDALALPHRALSGGRCHRKGQPPRLYASSTATAAWGELFRHVEPEISPFEVIRTMSTIEVTNLPVVDFDDPLVRAIFGVSETVLTSNNYAVCRRLADLLRERPDLFGGMILPSTAVPGEQTLVVFCEWIPGHLRVAKRETSTAPSRLLRLFEALVSTLARQLQVDARRVLRRAERDIRAAAQREARRIRRRP